ncbi:MAG: hypothetical protein AB7I33_17515 [Gemmatimonadales bacterium]
MGQWFWLDRPSRKVYFALILLAGCRGTPGPLLPVGAVPVTAGQVDGWVAGTLPHGHALHQFKWLFRDDRSSAGGIGRARVAAPDTLRFDARGPLGSGRMAAVVVGDDPLWAVPEDAVSRLVPSYPLLWAIFGVARSPDPGAALRGLSDGKVTAWQYALGADTVEYVYTRAPARQLRAEVRGPRGVIGRVETSLADDGQPVRARLTVPSVPARLDIEFVATDSTAAFPPDTWRPPEP